MIWLAELKYLISSLFRESLLSSELVDSSRRGHGYIILSSCIIKAVFLKFDIWRAVLLDIKSSVHVLLPGLLSCSNTIHILMTTENWGLCATSEATRSGWGMGARESRVGALVLAEALSLNSHRFLWCILVLWQTPPWSLGQSSNLLPGPRQRRPGSSCSSMAIDHQLAPVFLLHAIGTSWS